MHTVFEPTHSIVRFSHRDLALDSYDSGEEFSLHHWIEVCRLVDDDDVFLNDERTPLVEEFGQGAQDPLSEMEPAAAYQDFAGNVI